MKKLCTLILALALLGALCACGDYVSLMPGTELVRPGAEESAEDVFQAAPLLTYLGWEDFGGSYYTDTPVALSYQSEASDGTRGCRAYVFDRASIIAACDALRSMTVTAPSPEQAASGGEYVLTMADGDEYYFTFGRLADGSRVLSTYTGNYAVEGGDALWEIEFPAYSSSFDLFDLYFDDGVRAFADGFEQNTPVSVGYRLGSGATVTSDDPAVVRQAFAALSGATVTVVENFPDQNIDLTDVRDYIFTMADGTYYTFSFAQRCLAVTAAPDFGTVYYWLSGIDALWDVQIMAANNNGKFEGGSIGGLRDDIQTTVQVANGERTDLTVAGIFVEYTIGEESGYLTLDGDLAMRFIRQVAAIQVSSETVAEPTGDKITISVTLSDLSGPIFYFTGDAIQQVVGIHYICDSGDMAALRQTITELAAEGNNTAAIEEATAD